MQRIVKDRGVWGRVCTCGKCVPAFQLETNLGDTSTQVVADVAIGCGLLAVVTFARSGSGVAMARQAALLLAYGIAVMGVCVLACIGPALRALRVDPVEALREDA